MITEKVTETLSPIRLRYTGDLQDLTAARDHQKAPAKVQGAAPAKPAKPCSRILYAFVSKSLKIPSSNPIPVLTFSLNDSFANKASWYRDSTVSTITLALRRPAPITSPETCEHRARTACKVAYALEIPASKLRFP